MFKKKAGFIIVSAAIVALSAGIIVSAETWHLEKGDDLKAVSAQGQDKYLLAVAQIKKLVNTGQTKAVKEAVEQLKKDFPEIAGPDLDAFIKAELLFSKGKFVKAVRSYDKFLTQYPESELYQAALDREFAIATAFLAGRKRPILKIFRIRGYAEGQKIMERIIDRAGDAPLGEKAALTIVESLEKRKKFDKAYQKWSEISSKWPDGQMGRDALLGMARCKHAAYRGPKYNASNLISAKSYYENFKSRYPKYAEEINVDGKLKQINEQIAYKQFGIAKYYERTKNKQSANFYYQMVADNWPGSTAAKLVEKQQNKR